MGGGAPFLQQQTSGARRSSCRLVRTLEGIWVDLVFPLNIDLTAVDLMPLARLNPDHGASRQGPLAYVRVYCCSTRSSSLLLPLPSGRERVGSCTAATAAAVVLTECPAVLSVFRQPAVQSISVAASRLLLLVIFWLPPALGDV